MPRKRQVTQKGYERLKKLETDEKPEHAPVPPKPKTNQEVRLFQRILSGKTPPGPNGEPPRNVVSGTEKVWLTRSEAIEAGFRWREKPFLGPLRRVGVRSRAREEVDEYEGAGTDRDN